MLIMSNPLIIINHTNQRHQRSILYPVNPVNPV